MTLVEMLIVLGVMAIAAGLIVPMAANTNDMKVRTAADQMVAALMFAQTSAICQQRNYQVVFDSVNHSFEVQDEDGNVIPDPLKKMTDGVDPAEYEYRVVYPSSGHLQQVRIDEADFDGDSVVWFDGLGAPYSGALGGSPQPLSSGQVTISAGQHQFTISIEPVTGKVTVIASG